MIKVNIFNMKEFLQIVNKCVGEVRLVDSEGRKKNINMQYDIQSDLQHKHNENKQCLRLILDIPNAKDYMKIVFFIIGDC